MRKKDYYMTCCLLLNLLNDDDIYIFFFNTFPFSLLRRYVPMSYLASRYDNLKKKGKL